MNIFVLSTIPHKAAIALVDKHVVKMILEYVQLLCTAFKLVVPDKHIGNIETYKSTHVNHPCSVWVREKKVNFVWLSLLAIALCKEYTHRYGKIHKSEAYIRPMLNKIMELKDELKFEKENTITPITDFPLAMPENIRGCVNRGNPITAVYKYRLYYVEKLKKEWAKYGKNRKMPKYFT